MAFIESTENVHTNIPSKMYWCMANFRSTWHSPLVNSYDLSIGVGDTFCIAHRYWTCVPIFRESCKSPGSLFFVCLIVAAIKKKKKV